MIRKYTVHLIVFTGTLIFLLINYNWGLPNNKRLELVGGRDMVKANIPEIVRIGKKPALDDSFTYEETMHRAVYRSLLAPWAGDDTILLRAIARLNPYKLQFDPHHYIYGGGFVYTSAVFLQCAAWLGAVTVNPDMGYYLERPEEFGKICAVLRLMVVLVSTLGIFSFYWVTQRVLGLPVALVGWGLIMIIPETHASARGLDPHLFALVMFIPSYYFTYRATQGNITKNYVLAAVFAGFSIGTQSSSFFIIFSFFASMGINYCRERIDGPRMLKYFLMYAVVSTVSLLMLNPYYVLNYKGFMDAFVWGTGNQLMNSAPVWAPYQVTWIFLFLFLGGVCYTLVRKRDSEFLIMAVSCLLPAVFVYRGTGCIMQYIYSALPLAVMVSAVMLTEIHRSLSGGKRYVFTAAVIVLLALFPAGRSIYYIMNYTSENREAAGAWINENVPKGASVAVRYPPSLWDGVPFEFYNYRVVDFKKINQGSTEPLADAVILLNADLNEETKAYYALAKEYQPMALLGFRYELQGELHALIAKTVRVYMLKP